MKALLALLRPLALPVTLIAAVCALLLYMDGSARKASAASKIPHVAVIQHASQASLDEGLKGLLDTFTARGYVDGKNIRFQIFNAEGDIATANSIAQQVTDGSFDLIMTISTTSMQTVANVNKQRRIPHVFGLVADPYSAGVGANRDKPLDHPPYMAGVGTMVPVGKPLDIALAMNPSMKRVGMVWNSAESNSRAYAEATRAACATLGLELLEANAENSSSVGEAASSLVARGIDAILVTGDVSVLVAVDSLVAAARRGHIPVFSLIPPNTRKGAIFDFGADFVQLGVITAQMGIDVLQGRKRLTEIPILNVVPERLYINLVAISEVKDRWRLPPALLEQASVVIDETGEHAGPAAGVKLH